jgi:molecular chaperone DnaK (HSP70)
MPPRGLHVLLVSAFILLSARLLGAVPTAEEEVAIGIDLGTSFTVVSYHPDQLRTARASTNFFRSPQPVETAGGSFLLPSVVTFDAHPPRNAAVGEAAKNLAATIPERTVAGAKVLIGRFYNSSEVTSRLKTLSYEGEQSLTLRTTAIS